METKDKVPFKKWFENYWYYYRVHTIIGFFLIIILTYSLVECVNKVNPDAEVIYFGTAYFNDDFSASLIENLSPLIDDINNDGKKTLIFTPLTMSKETKSEQDMAIQQKAQLIIAVGEGYLYLMDKDIFDFYSTQDLFADISPYLGETEPVYCFSASESKLLKELGLKDNSNIYIALRVMNQGDEKKPKKIAPYNNAIRILSELAKKD